MRLLLGLCLALWLGQGSSAFAKEQTPQVPLAVITQVDVSESKDHQVIALQLSKDYEQSITYLYDPGVFSAILPKTKVGPKVKNIRVNNQFLDQIRLRSENNRTILEIRFADHAFSGVGKVTHLAEFDQLSFKVYPKKPDPSAINGVRKTVKSTAVGSAVTGTNPIGSQPEEKENPLEIGDLAPSIDNYDLIQMLVVLAIVLALIYSMLWAYNRYFVKKLNFRKGPYQIRVASTFHLGPKQKVVVLEINEMAFACSVSQQQISVIAQVDKGDFEQFMGSRGPIAQDSVDFASLRDEYRESRSRETPEPSPEEPKVSFATELLDKVKRLKPID